MILEFTLSISLHFDKNIRCVKYTDYKYTSPITTEFIEHYQFTTKDINPNLYDYIKIKNQQLLDQQMIDQLDSDNDILQDEE